jgi:hypothetical protein
MCVKDTFALFKNSLGKGYYNFSAGSMGGKTKQGIN